MTSPDLYQPNQPGRLEDIKPTIGGLANIMLSNVGTIAQNIFRGVADAVAGLFKNQDGPLGEISDGQLALADRTGLLEGVRGYCAAYQSLNINSEWNVLSSNDRWLPYESPLGPSKGAHIEVGKNIVFEEEGLWLVFVQAHARSTSFGDNGSNLSAIYVTIYYPDGTTQVRDVVFDQPNAGNWASVGGSFPVVIPEPGCWIKVRAWSSRWRWWDGGARNAWMAVVKQDNRLTNKGQDTVPDETQ
ncbi:MAG: hypothetical protein ACLT2I_02680 [Corynebacterium variabile]